MWSLLFCAVSKWRARWCSRIVHVTVFFRVPKFDFNLAHKAAELIRGKHDFRTFMGADQQNSEQVRKLWLRIGFHDSIYLPLQDHPAFSLRQIDSIKIEPCESTCNVFSKTLADENYNYFNIHISGRSFLNRQVRRIVAVILGVAQDRLTIRDVYEMLTIPSKHSWSSKVPVAPAHGLYLCQVEYDRRDKEFPVSATTNGPPENELSQWIEK